MFGAEYDLLLKRKIQEEIQQGERPRYLYRYCSLDERLQKSLAESYLWFSNLLDFNDPYEGKMSHPERYSDCDIWSFANDRFSHPQSAKPLVDASHEERVNILNEATCVMLHETKVCCFSEVPDNILMWSHYAKSHTGVCLKFDLTVPCDTFDFPLKVIYQKHYMMCNIFQDVEETIQQLIQTKSDLWSYEQEVRIVKIHETANKIQFPNDALVGVIFGCRTDSAKKRLLMNLLGMNKQYAHCVVDEKEYKLNIEQVAS